MVLGKMPRFANKQWAIQTVFRVITADMEKGRESTQRLLYTECQNSNIRTSTAIVRKCLHWGYGKLYLIRENVLHGRCLPNSKNIYTKAFFSFLYPFLRGQKQVFFWKNYLNGCFFLMWNLFQENLLQE
jgi:hypothetical protein